MMHDLNEYFSVFSSMCSAAFEFMRVALFSLIRKSKMFSYESLFNSYLMIANVASVDRFS